MKKLINKIFSFSEDTNSSKAPIVRLSIGVILIVLAIVVRMCIPTSVLIINILTALIGLFGLLFGVLFLISGVCNIAIVRERLPHADRYAHIMKTTNEVLSLIRAHKNHITEIVFTADGETHRMGCLGDPIAPDEDTFFFDRAVYNSLDELCADAMLGQTRLRDYGKPLELIEVNCSNPADAF